ncbi:MAG: isocitrate lyase/phosphoenolpyruvate mutase family protein, partial [Quisquiliibacterium sp.]
LHPGSVFDPISARIAQDLGFELGMFAGSVASLVILGSPDIALITLTEFAEQARRICRAATGLPLLVDADHGYGNALGVMRTVQEIEAAGVSALTIEDTLLPQAHGEGAGIRLTSIEEGVGKMKGALAARQDPSMVIVGRTSAISVTGVNDTIDRLQAYEACGVDALFLVGVKTREQLQAVSSATRLPLILGGVPDELSDSQWLASQRVRICLQGHAPYMAAIGAAYQTLKALREGTPPAKLERLPSPELIKQASRESDYAKLAKDLL